MPLALYAVVCDRQLLLLLAAAGLVITVYRLSTSLVYLTNNNAAQTLIRFITLALTGVGIIYGGFVYQNLKFQIQNKINMCSKTCCSCCAKNNRSDAQVAVEEVEMTDNTDNRNDEPESVSV